MTTISQYWTTNHKITQFYQKEPGDLPKKIRKHSRSFALILEDFLVSNQLSIIDKQCLQNLGCLLPEIQRRDDRWTRIYRCKNKAQSLLAQSLKLCKSGISPAFERYVSLHIDFAKQCTEIMESHQLFWFNKTSKLTKQQATALQRTNNARMNRQRQLISGSSHLTSQTHQSQSRNQSTERERSRQKSSKLLKSKK